MRRLIEVRKPCEWWSRGTWGVPQLANKLHGLWGVGCKASHKSWDVPWSVITRLWSSSGESSMQEHKLMANEKTFEVRDSVIFWMGFYHDSKNSNNGSTRVCFMRRFFCFALIWKLWPVFQSNQNSRSLSPYLWRPHTISDRLPCLRTRVEVGGTCSRWWTHVILGMVGLRIKQLQGLLGHLFSTESFEMKPLLKNSELQLFWGGSEREVGQERTSNDGFNVKPGSLPSTCASSKGSGLIMIIYHRSKVCNFNLMFSIFQILIWIRTITFQNAQVFIAIVWILGDWRAMPLRLQYSTWDGPKVLLLIWTDGLLPSNPGYDFLEIFAGKQAVTKAWLFP